MRIRKNLLRVPSESGTHLCQLNQSPWDVITTSSSSSTPLTQVQEDESFFEHKAFESVASLKIFSASGGDNSCLYDEEEEKEAVHINYCAKTDEHGNWICGLEAKEGVTFCEFHLRSYIAPLIHPVTKKSSSKISEAKKSKPESNTYKDLYYYDGFGPSWGKRRVARELSKAGENVAVQQLPSNSEDEDEEDMEEDDDIEVENGNDNGKKRGRKRMKARSLKSLM